MLYIFHAGCGLVLCVLSGVFVLLCRRVIFFGNFIRALVVCSEYVVLRIFWLSSAVTCFGKFHYGNGCVCLC